MAGALSTRAGAAAIAAQLAASFTAVAYDRRGRGDSGDEQPYAVEREIEDIAALIGALGGSAFVFGHSSGAVLSLRATAAGLPIPRLALYEPPFIVDDSRPLQPPGYVEHLEALLAAGRRGDAVAYFLTASVGMPEAAVAGMRADPSWPGLEALAHTIAVRRSGDGGHDAREPGAARPVGVGVDPDAGHRWRREPPVHACRGGRPRRRAAERRTPDARRPGPRRGARGHRPRAGGFLRAFGRLGSGRGAGSPPLEPVEDQVETERELDVVVAGAERAAVAGRRRERRDRGNGGHRPARRRRLGRRRRRRVIEQVLAEPEDPAAQDVQRVVGELQREPAARGSPGSSRCGRESPGRMCPAPRAPAAPTGGGASPRARPGPGRAASPSSHRRAGPVDLADEDLDDAIQQVVLVPDVTVERHRLDAELLAELAHAERIEPASVGELDGGQEHAFAASAGRDGRRWRLLDRHLDEFTV